MASAGDLVSTSAALARYYDLDLAEDPADVEMYLALADSVGGPVLELAAGTGRVSVPLAAAGHDVLAVDRDGHMLERARARWAAPSHEADRGSALALEEADITTWRPQRSFGLVLIALNSLLLLDRAHEQRAALDTVAASLAPDGRAVIDIWLPAPEDLALYDGRLVLDWVRRDLETGETVAKTTSARYSPAARTADITSFFDAWRDGGGGTEGSPRRVTRRDRVSFLTASELIALAEAAGLTVDTVAGDYEMGPFADDSDRLVLICRSGLG